MKAGSKMSFSMYFDNKNKTPYNISKPKKSDAYKSIILTDADGNMLSNAVETSDGENRCENSLFKQTSNNLINNILPRKTFVWILDPSVYECYSCNLEFGLINRKHHCRLCGRIFCYECSKFYVNYYNLDPYKLIDREKYMDFYMSDYKNYKSHRVCMSCKQILKQIKDLSNHIKSLELLALDIKSYTKMKMTGKNYYYSVSIILSRIREIQYHLPGHIYTTFEMKYLLNNIDDILGHNRYFRNYLKVLDKSKYPTKQIISYLSSKLDDGHKFTRTYDCWILMCGRECNRMMDINDIIDILLNVENEDIREFVVGKFLNKLEISDVKLACFLPILVYSIRFDKFKNGLAHYLIERAKKSHQIKLGMYWELKVQAEDTYFQNKYIQINNLFKKEMLSFMGYPAYNLFIKHQEITNDLFIFKNKSKLIDNMKNKTIKDDSFTYELPVYSEGCPVHKFHTNHIKLINSATQPLMIPFNDENENLKHILFKNEDIRKDRIVTLIIRMFDIILKENDLDMNIIKYDVVPVSMGSGIIEIVDNSTTIYDIYNLHDTNLLNYILEKNPTEKISDVRNKFITSLAAYCVITYLLGIGDRHLDNILIKDDGCLFHIDFNFILGADPKMFKSEIRITNEMITALGGVKSDNFDTFLKYVDKIYTVLRRYPDLILNCLFLLTKIKTQHIDLNILREQVYQRFMPGELETKANLSIKNTINSSSKKGGLTDFLHYQAKENFLVKMVKKII
jgi:hypothetical protein